MDNVIAANNEEIQMLGDQDEFVRVREDEGAERGLRRYLRL
jgi:hypothetical protein